MEQEQIQRVNSKLREVADARSSGSITLARYLARKIPVIGNAIARSNRRRRYVADLRGLDKLVEAFHLGYVPGGIDGEPKEWSWCTQIWSYELAYHPENREHAKEVTERLQEAMEDNTCVLANQQPIKGYTLAFTVTALMDLQGLSPPMKTKPRRIEYGNPDESYWAEWSNEIRKHILARLR
jgi:hypothetical protein